MRNRKILLQQQEENMKLLYQVGGGVDITVKLSIHANGGICTIRYAGSAKIHYFLQFQLLCNGKRISLKERVKYRLQIL
jgi:hypothetical protein